MYVELTDMNEIEEARAELIRTVNKELKHKQNRWIGYPAGVFEGEVRFKSSSGTASQWVFSGVDPKSGIPLFFCGRGDPKAKDTLNIDLQFNLPKKKFTRNFGGAFVRDLESGAVLLAHRGIVTRGKSRVPKELLLLETTERPQTVSVPGSGKELQLFVVGPVSARGGVMGLIGDFAVEIRRAATEVMAGKAKVDKGRKKGKGPTSAVIAPRRSMLDAALSEFFREFEGKTKVSMSKTVVRNCRHGAVVNALKVALAGQGKIMKSMQMDLVLFRNSEALVFEVKTSAKSTATYTAIGQLFLHSSLVKQLNPKLTVTRHIVLPDEPGAHLRNRLRAELGIGVVAYQDDGKKVTFSELP
jgi:hypothetical protein